MDSAVRGNIQRATQSSRTLLEEAYREQLEGTYDILLDGTIAEAPGSHLSDRQKVTRSKLVAAVAHKRSTGLKAKEAVDAYLREAAFTTLNRFVALKMLEARSLVQECISKGEDSSGFKEFTALAPGLVALEDKGYRLYIETLFDEIGQEVKVLFDRRDVASLLWPDRQTLLELLGILNAPELSSVWAEDETIGWVYQYFNGDEERTQMRKESQSPRNSRELAVRNQFFTPRYVVQFLTDNTLGRTWYEMMQGDTQLAHLDYLVRRPNEVFLAEGESAPESDTDDSEFSQEELLQQTVHVPFRAKKDPRDLRILDPACGSGHFLLYTFDLLITIYEEAWADAGAAAFTETGTQLRADYESLDDLRRAMPELILRHNLHGVDIDPRAAQIAALALWMRAQRAYNQFEVDRAQRPPITKTNIVVAEPMPGDAELVDEFAASLKPAVLGDLFKKMVEEMKLAGELGSLLKIEESIAKAVKEASEASQQGNLFAGKVESQDFWDTADEKIIAALGSFAESAAGAGGVRRQLFAGDAAQGVAFIELMRKRFDAVLMNPPFGRAPSRAFEYCKVEYKGTYTELYGSFVHSCQRRWPQARVGILSSNTLEAINRLKEWRAEDFIPCLELYVGLGSGVLDAMVKTAAYVVGARAEKAGTFFFDVTGADEKESVLEAFCQTKLQTGVYWVRRRAFADLPESRLLYRMPAAIWRVLSLKSSIEPAIATVRQGLSTFDDFRFLRLVWEVPEESLGRGLPWVPFSKGGDFETYYADVYLAVRWGVDGDQLAAVNLQRNGQTAQSRQGESYYYSPGVTFTPRSQRGFSARALGADCIMSNKGPKVLSQSTVSNLCLLGFLNADITRAAVHLQSNDMFFPAGLLKKHPWIQPSAEETAKIESYALQAWAAKKRLGEFDETHRCFRPEALLFNDNNKVADHMRQLVERRDALVNESVEAANIVSEIVAQLYGCVGIALSDFGVREDDHKPSVAPFLGSQRGTARAILSFFLGRALGHWTSSSCMENEADEPFDSFDQRPLMDRTTSSLQFASSMAVDDPGHLDDIVHRVQLTANSDFRCELSQASEDVVSLFVNTASSSSSGLRDFIRDIAFTDHLSRYSKSRRKAPIYWQLAIPSASYSVWCYYHRLTRDTFFRVANDYVTPKVDHEERKLNTLRQEAGPDPSSKQRKEIDAQETFVAELRAFLTEVKRIAPLWNPNLNDGVIINFAPLWRLVPQHKAWQKECKKVWDKLVKGDYDWAHLAMHLWPERVVPKCQDDRSLAIAHGLEDDFWYEDDEGKKTVWKKRQVSAERVAELVAERSSSAVKAALKELLEAPTPAGKSGTRRKRS